MAKKLKKNENLTLEEKLEQALIPNWDEPYKLPENWCWVTLGTVCKLNNGEKSSEEELTYFDAKTLRGKDAISTRHSGVVIDKGQKVILVDGENSGEVFTVPFRGYMGSTFKIIDISECVNETFIQLFIDHHRDELRKNKIGSAIPHLNKELFFGLNLPLPPANEQIRIVDRIENFFAKLDDAKEKAQEVIDGFENRKAAILHKAFTGELTAKWRKENTPTSACAYLEELKNDVNYSIRSEIKYWNNESLPKGWCESKIGNLLYFAGRIGWKGLKAEEYTTSGPLLLSVYNLNDGDEVTYNRVYHITQERYEESPEIMVEIGDVLLTKDGAGIGKLGYVKELPEEATINSSLLLLRPSKSAVSKYIYYVLLGPALQNIVKERITGSATPHLFQRDIKEFVLPIPSLEEQIEIVRVLDNMLLNENKAKEFAELVLEQIDVIKKSILARAFRGELGTNDPDEESAVELIKKHIEETIKEVPSRVKKSKPEKIEVNVVAKTIIEALQNIDKLTPERLKAETQLDIDDFYEQLKTLIDSGKIKETRIDGESYLEAVK